jgi:hypothetical protein
MRVGCLFCQLDQACWLHPCKVLLIVLGLILGFDTHVTIDFKADLHLGLHKGRPGEIYIHTKD